MATLTEEETATLSGFVSIYFKDVQKEAIRTVMLHEGKRLDGRKFDEIRPIWAEVDYLPIVHGSAVFTRGETQSLTTLTLGGKMDEQMLDGVTHRGTEKFMLHYNFPPFSTGEARPLRGTSRREVGHGNLAQRALKNMLPTDYPYTVRLVSEILESNGSSSMTDGGRFAVLSDILGDEDHLGDMDFKVTGTAKGITACQMDIKVDGLPYEVLIQALEQAKAGRIHILDKIVETLAVPNPELKPQTPRIEAFVVPNEMIGALIGPGGKIIQAMQKETNTIITIEEIEGGQGRVQVMSNNADDMNNAVGRIKSIAFPPTVEVDKEYEGKIKSLQAYGCFVEILPGVDGLIHISEFNWEKIAKMEDVCKEGDVIRFKVMGKDEKTKKWKLSRKVLLPRPEKKDAPSA